MKNPNKYSRKILLFSAIVFIFVVLALLYFFAWRPSDKDYQTLSNNLTVMNESQSAIDESVGGIRNASAITVEFIASVADETAQYNSAFKSLSSNSVVSRDVKTTGIFNDSKNTFARYGESAKNLSDSLKKYELVSTTCTDLVDKISTLSSVKAFDDAAGKCNNAINDAKSASYTALKKQYLDAYTEQAAALISAYRQVMSQTEAKAKSISMADIIAINQKIADLQQNELNLTPTPDPSSGLQKLINTANSQKSALIR